MNKDFLAKVDAVMHLLKKSTDVSTVVAKQLSPAEALRLQAAQIETDDLAIQALRDALVVEKKSL